MGQLKDFFNKTASNLHATVQEKGFEKTIEIPSDSGKGQIKGYDFGEGLNLIDIDADIYRLIQLEFDDSNKQIVRYLFLNSGDLVHTLSPGFRYRLTSHTSSIAFLKENDYKQKIILPAQKNIKVLLLQINTEKYAVNFNRECIAVPDELAKVFMQEYDKTFFLYQSAYPLSVYEAQKGLYERETDGILKSFFLESKALELIWMQTENYRNEELEGFQKDVLRKKDIEIITKAKDHIRQNLHEDLTIKGLAREIGTNETKLKKGLKILYGKTFGDILRNERLNQAKALLETNEMSIKEVALKCGYLSGSIFAKRFKEKFGVLPKNYLIK